MTIKELDQRLTLVLEDFSSEMRSEYDDYSNEPVTGGDIAVVIKTDLLRAG